MNYKKHIFVLALFTGIIASAFSQSSQQQPYTPGENVGLLPIFKEGFHPQISIAPQVGYISFSDMNSSGIIYGIEAALQCPLLCTKKNYIRQQLSFLYYNDLDFTYWNLTLNPEYRFIATPGFELAAGPSLGISNSKIAFNNDVIEDFNEAQFTYGLSSSTTWHFGKTFVALSTRYMLTGENEIVGTTNANFNNFQGLLKFGVNL